MKSMTRYRWMVASRILAAVVVGYALASAISILLALIWPIPKAEAVLASTMLSFAIYAAVVLWVFATKSVLRAWIGLLIPLAIISLLCWWLMPGGAA
ncbi:DUF3649 domain-containing protein [Methylobacillus gramineus]|uniref:DUF3649 domain-containing protein n=1 Tax=Methylobacillus gramineus TaxID=755169 RepID=UPI001CFF6563|nr:DUF3649 domain-containing protein [Methylobacillus gramineus]MCB5185766.1 DUF3649 domain-containing protein [Methylobacillus gramineus]